MLKPNSVVSSIVRFDPPLDRPPAEMVRTEGGLGVELEGGRVARLDPENPRSTGYAQVLEGLFKLRSPVYLELDPKTSAITNLLIPEVTRVHAVREDEGGGLIVELERSHGRHLLPPDAPDFEDLAGRLREAMRAGGVVILTEDDAHNILDIRGYTPGPEGQLPPFPKPELPKDYFDLREFLDRFWLWPWWPWWWFRCVSMKKAQQVFDAMSATSCSPLTVPPPCIPFLYPDDGCWARAHEMCRLMIAMGLRPKKVWIQGNLHVDTKNNPNCYVNWGWHVAPTLCVRKLKPWWFGTEELVVDPSLFITPISKAGWKGVQGDPSATLTDSDASIYYLWGSVTDPLYTDTNIQLNKYRLKLQTRAINFGPPPYASCP